MRSATRTAPSRPLISGGSADGCCAMRSRASSAATTPAVPAVVRKDRRLRIERAGTVFSRFLGALFRHGASVTDRRGLQSRGHDAAGPATLLAHLIGGSGLALGDDPTPDTIWPGVPWPPRSGAWIRILV